MNEIEIVVRAHDLTGPAFKEAKAGAKDLDSSGSKSLEHFGKASVTAMKAVALMGAKVATVGSLAIPAAFAAAKFAVQAAHIAASVGPAAAGLLPLAAGLELVKRTITLAGPAMLKAISPVTNAFKAEGVQVGKIASEGLTPLARSFVKVNFPSIKSAMDSIAGTTNKVVKGYMQWINTTQGQKAISNIAGDTARTFKQLGPGAERVAKAITGLAGRASGSAFKAFGDGAKYALDKVAKFIDGISASDVSSAFAKLKQWGKDAQEGFQKAGDGIKWLSDHQGQLSKFSDVLSILGIAGGLAVGPEGWPTALASAGGLVAKHWGSVGPVFDKVKDSLKGAGGNFQSMKQPTDAAKGAVDDVKKGFGQFVDAIKPAIATSMPKLRDAWIRLQPAIAGIVTVLGKAIGAYLKFAGPAMAAELTFAANLIDAFGKVVDAAMSMTAQVLQAFADMFKPIADMAKKLHLPFADAMEKMVTAAQNGANNINGNLKQVNTDIAQAHINDLRSDIARLKGKKVVTGVDQARIRTDTALLIKLQDSVNAVHGKAISVVVHYGSTGSTAQGAHQNIPVGQAHGGVIGRAASGGVRNGFTLVGEHGAELIKASPGSTVRSNEDSRRMMAAAGPGGASPGPVRLEWVGGNAGDAFMTWLRKNIRAQGGNVQQVLGR